MRIISGLLCSILLSCSPKTSSATVTTRLDSNRSKTDTIPSIYLQDLEWNTVARWFYGDNIELDTTELKKGDTIVSGRIKNDMYEGPNGYVDEFVHMHGSFQSEYLEDGITKSVMIFEGDNYYQHGHTWYLLDVLFFEKENNRWKFLDSLQIQDFDVGEIQRVNLCKNGLSIWFEGQWANMGGLSERETFIGFRNEEAAVYLNFWTYSGRMRDEEPYDMIEEDSARVEIKENPDAIWNTIYYYSMKYDCTQKDAEDDLGFCSSKWVFENGEYKVYPLKKNERKR